MSDNGKPKYFVGLDCGTSSVGWAVTDENYKLLRRRGKTMWGMRLFDEASTAAERRSYRSVRRRLARRRGRIRLLQQLFSSDIASVDPDFYIRLRESIYLESDKRGLRNLSKNTLFNDSEYTDKDYHNEYPTIWHLRKAIIESASNPDKHFDIRLYYLAIEHIIKHRGHFLREGKVEGAGNFADLYDDLANKAKICNIAINEYAVDNVESLLKQKISKTDKKKQLSEAMFADVDNDEYDGDFKLLAHMLCGSSVNLNKLFNIESDEDAKIDFSKDDLEEKLSNISDFVSAVDGAEDLILAAKQIYDYIYLSDLLAGNDSISAAMVANYDQHQKDLAEIKAVLKPFDDDYRRFFKQKAGEGVYYNAYIGKGSKDGGKKAYSVNQEAINKELRSLFEKHGIGGELLKKAEDSKLLPKQRGFAKGTIPQQLHHNELEIILQKLIQDYPSFGQESADEDEAYNTKAKKIASIHSFRIPYYCGPMRSKAQPNNEFCWADEEIEETVYPWNYNQLVDLGARASKFIDRMTNECTYIAGAQVLPKCSLMYQRYMVLNELNNLKINGCRIDNDIKQQIFNQGYLDGELSGNITLKKLSCWMKTVGIMDDKDELGGTADHKALPRLNTHYDFYRILGDGYNKRYSAEALEQVVKLITILNNERKMLANKIRQTIDCTEEQARRLAKLNYKDWGRFSAKFLSGIRANINGQNLTILEALWETPNNLMELLSDKYEFVTRLDEINQAKKPADNQPLTYEQVDNLYCSPAVKRTVWQTIKIINEIRKVMGYDPAKVFIEMTRGNAKGDHKVKLSRRKDLLKKYEAIKDNQDEFAKAFSELNKKEDRDLQSKKLFLYFQQGGKCAYTGERIEIEEINNTSLYDIDHIYPRSKTKDDSLSNNLVLVKAEKNREKTNIYPISDDIRAKMHGKWALWRHYGLITKEKYERLTRATPLTADELAGFIARQIVETSQSTKAICDLLKRGLDNTQVVTVKAGGVSDLRHYYGYNATNPRPEFIKIRNLNDTHHAKDAYLNIVVGNVINSTFTNNPLRWIKDQPTDERNNYNYSIRTDRIFRESEKYTTKDGRISDRPHVKNWNFAESLEIVSHAMRRNDVLWTRMNHALSNKGGGLVKATIVRKAENYIPIKRDNRLRDTSKYGGYTGVAGAYFALVELTNGSRKIMPIPLLHINDMDNYIQHECGDGAKIIIPRIDFMSYMKVDGFPVHLAGSTGNSLSFYPSVQLFIDPSNFSYLKKVSSVVAKDSSNRGKYLIANKDGISRTENASLFKLLLDKVQAMSNRPELKATIDKIDNSCYDKFNNLDIKKQCTVICEILKVLACNPEKGNLSAIIDKANTVGTCRVSNSIDKLDSIALIYQSPTGLYEKVIDLKTVQSDEV